MLRTVTCGATATSPGAIVAAPAETAATNDSAIRTSFMATCTARRGHSSLNFASHEPEEGNRAAPQGAGAPQPPLLPRRHTGDQRLRLRSADEAAPGAGGGASGVR